MSTARQIARDVLGRTLRGSYWEADKALTALAAAGFVVIRPTDPEVIERAAQALGRALANNYPALDLAATDVLAALGELTSGMPSICGGSGEVAP